MDFQHVAIVGPGLLGGSVALALRDVAKVKTSLWGRREEVILQARDQGIADVCSTHLETVVSGADLVILATPIGVMPNLARLALPFLNPGTIVTDVGSVKGTLVAQMERLFSPETEVSFIGSHPMAGSEKLGLDQAKGDLLNGAACFVTPTPNSRVEAVGRVIGFWETLGMRTYQLSAEDHDRAVAAISHLPHAVAALLVEAALEDDPGRADYLANGFRDTTRIASGSPEMWTGILRDNREALREALLRFQAKLGDLLAFLDEVDEKNLLQFLASAKQRRDDAVDR